jgi:transposase
MVSCGRSNLPAARCATLRSLVEHRRALIDERTALTNRLQALLKLYFPQALELLSEDLWRRMDCEFLQR